MRYRLQFGLKYYFNFEAWTVYYWSLMAALQFNDTVLWIYSLSEIYTDDSSCLNYYWFIIFFYTHQLFKV